MFENASTYTWWDIEDRIDPLAVQAVDRWESLGLPKDSTENPVALQVWVTPEGGVAYAIALLYGDTEVYTAEGYIKISGVSRRVALAAAESTIIESAEDLVDRSIASDLARGLWAWLWLNWK